MIYRNWPEICKVKFHLLLLTLSTIDLESDEGLGLVSVFPECFSNEPVQGPIPLSVLRKESQERAVAERVPRELGDQLLQSFSVLSLHNIPYISFDTYGRQTAGCTYPIRPDHIPVDAKLGDIVEHEGSKWVVVENNDSCEEIHLAPLECIDPNA